MAYLKMMWQLIGYALVATLLISPLGWFYIACGIGCSFRSQYCMRQWFALDVLACTTIHGTYRRTISGYTGQRLHLKRYKLQARVIDRLALMFGDSENHCFRTYEWERQELKF